MTTQQTQNSKALQELIDLGLNPERLAQHSEHELRLALCACQESGSDIEMIEEIGDEATEISYAESALGW